MRIAPQPDLAIRQHHVHSPTHAITHTYTITHIITHTGHNTLYLPWPCWSRQYGCRAPHGQRLASGSQGDATVQIWEALSGKRVYTYRGHNANVYAALWSPNGQYIASGGDDGTVRVWQAV